MIGTQESGSDGFPIYTKGDFDQGALDELAQAFREVARRFACTVDEISPEIGEALVGAVQESLDNVLKHCSATECTVEIGVDDETVCATIRDNGHGDLGEDGFGLCLMRERVRRFGGALSIEAIPAEGIVVRVRLPLTSETEA